MTGVARAAVAVQAGDDAPRSGDSGSVGVTWRGKADTPSHGDVGVEKGRMDGVVGVFGGVVACGVANGCVAGADSGERSSSFSSSWS